MPAYVTKPQSQQVSALYPGDSITLVNNAASDTGITKTLQFSVGPVPGNAGNTIIFYNSTNQDAQLAYSNTEVLAGGSGSSTYESLSGGIVASGTALPYNVAGGWICATFTTAPTSGSLIAAR